MNDSVANLKIYEALTLLALCDKKGTISASYFNFALAGAVLAELLLRNEIQVQEGRKQLIEVVPTHGAADETRTDPLFTSFITAIESSKRPRHLKGWVTYFANRKEIREQAIEALMQRGIVARQEQTILWLFTRRVYPQVEAQPEQALRQRLRQAIKFDSGDVEPYTGVLIALTHHARMLPAILGRQAVKRHRKRIEQISKGERVAAATKDVIAACEAAMMVAVMIPVMTATVVSS